MARTSITCNECGGLRPAVICPNGEYRCLACLFAAVVDDRFVLVDPDANPECPACGCEVYECQDCIDHTPYCPECGEQVWECGGCVSHDDCGERECENCWNTAQFCGDCSASTCENCDNRASFCESCAHTCDACGEPVPNTVELLCDACRRCEVCEEHTAILCDRCASNGDDMDDYDLGDIATSDGRTFELDDMTVSWRF